MVDTISEDISRIIDTPQVSEEYPTLDDMYVERGMLFACLPLKKHQIGINLSEVHRTGKLHETYANTVIRIYGETNLFKDYEELGLLEPVLTEGELKSIEGVRVEWSQDLKGVRGVYLPSERKIRINEPLPDRALLLETFAKYGTFPVSICTLVHELIHHMQKGEKEGIRESVVELCEAQALSIADAAPADYTNEDLVSFAKAAQQEYADKDLKPLDVDKLRYALSAVKYFRTFRLNIRGIAELMVNAGDWDPEKKIYPLLQKIIDDSSKMNGLSPEAVDNLIERDRIKIQIDRLKVMQIAQEELINATVGQTA